MDNRVFANSHLGTGWVDRIEGDTSQLIVATEPYSAGLQQQVTGLTPGVGYGFHAAMLTIFQTSAQPPVGGMMHKQVGIDPTGGTDPQAPTVIWDEIDSRDQEWSINLRTAVYAQSPTMTVFIRVISPYESGHPSFLNLSFLDSAILAQTPTVHAVSPAISEVPTFSVNWDNAVKAPVSGQLRWLDVQWLDEAEGVWHDWFTETFEVEATFVGDWGHTYRFRARAWQRYPNGAHLYGPYSADGDTTTRVLGSQLVGSVLSPEDHPVGGATIAISGTTHTAISGPDGSYALNLPVLSDTQTVTISHPAWLAPAPVYGVSMGPTETMTLTWTLIPPDDVIINGEFEMGLDGHPEGYGWSLVAEQGVTPTVVTEPVHTGLGSLALGGAPPVSVPLSVTIGGMLPMSAPVSYTVGVTQRVVVTNAWEPALSFWYHPVSTDTQDLFNVVLTVVTQTTSSTLPVTTTLRFTPSLDVPGWQHAWYYPGLPEAYLTGTVTIRFQVWNGGDDRTTTVYLDEVSLGATPGGPHKIYLPTVLRGA
jgi:hypothetical protein